MRGRMAPFALFLILTAWLALWPGTRVVHAAGGSVVISQVFGGGGNTGAAYHYDFVELFNPGLIPISLDGWSVQYAPGGSTTQPWQVTPLSGTILPGHYYLLQQAAGAGGGEALPTPDATGTIALSATAGKVALVSGAAPLAAQCPGEVVDLVGYGSANCWEGSGTVAGPGNTAAAVRVDAGCVDTDDTAADFATAAPAPRNGATPATECDRSGPDVFVSASAPSVLPAGYVVTYTLTYGNRGSIAAEGVRITDTLPAGVGVPDIVNDTSALPHGDASGTRVWTLDAALAPGASTSFQVAIRLPSSVTAGSTLINRFEIGTITPDELAPANDMAEASGTAYPVMAVGAVQGLTDTSPISGTTALVRGVVYGLMQSQRKRSAIIDHGFFIQSRPGTTDGNPATSDGLYVFLGSGGNKIGSYVPAAGDEILLQGTVTESYGLTELKGPLAVVQVLNHYDALDRVLPPTEMVRPDERLEGMRVKVPSALVVAPTHLYADYGDTECFVVHPDSPVGQRSDGFTRRVYRDQYDPNETAYLVSTEANALKASVDDYDVQLPAANVYDQVEGELVGPLYYAFGKYTLEVEMTPTLTSLANPLLNEPVQETDRAQQFTMQTANLENLYDALDDPTSPCDYNGGDNPGCPALYPGGSTSLPPFDYPAASREAYQLKVAKLAEQVITGTHAPDIIVVEEAEAQDICTQGGQLYGTCGGTATTGNADRKLDVLQDLAQEIYLRSSHCIEYDVASDLAGADYRGIIVGFMYRTDRVELVAAGELDQDPVLGPRPADPYVAAFPNNGLVQNPKALQATFPLAEPGSSTWLYDRRPQVALFRVHRQSIADDESVEVYAIGNHFKSGPDTDVDRRTEQASFNARLVDQILQEKPAARVAVMGDLNVYPDSPQLASLDIRLDNLYYQIPGPSRYSYSYGGTSQTLDQIFVTSALAETLSSTRVAHMNADWAEAYESDPIALPRTSDHDPMVATFRFTASGVSLTPSSASLSGDPGQVAHYQLRVTNLSEAADSYSVTVAGNKWPAVLSAASIGPLLPGAGADLTVDVTVPADSRGGAIDTATITVRSQSDAMQSAASTLKTTANTLYGAELSPASAAQSGDPGTQVTYTLTLINTSNGQAILSAHVAGQWNPVLNQQLFPAEPGMAQPVTVTVSIPEAALGGAWDTATVVVEPLQDSSKQVTAILTTTARHIYGVDISPAVAGSQAVPGTAATYTLRITNAGNSPDSFDLSATGSAWPVDLPAVVGPLDPGAGTDVTVHVQVPAEVALGTQDTVTVAATSRADAGKHGSATITTTAGDTYGVELGPATAAGSAGYGRVASYTLTVTNTGGSPDSILIAVDSSWPAKAAITKVDLAAGAHATFQVGVTVPPSAERGDTGVTTVTATSQGDGSQQKQSTLVTTASWYRGHVPLLLRR